MLDSQRSCGDRDYLVVKVREFFGKISKGFSCWFTFILNPEVEPTNNRPLRYMVWVRNALFLHAQLCELCDSAVLLRKH